MSFAFKIDKALKANLYKICRLCGIDRDETVLILDAPDNAGDPVDCDGDLELHQKINECIGIMVSKDDKMPQSACTLCVDKINDFYEFREMCYATDVQTRKLLGLKSFNIQRKFSNTDIKLITDIKEEAGTKRNRKRKPDESMPKEDAHEVKREPGAAPSTNKKQRLTDVLPISQKKSKVAKQLDKTIKPKEEIKEESFLELANTSSVNALKFRQVCNICEERFGSKVKLDQHLASTHTASIPRYVCTACNETIKKTNDIKSHQLWHKLSKTPYMCGLCDQSLTSSYAYSRHLRDHNFTLPSEFWVLDRQCPQCNGTFVTNFLYNTHPCAVRTKRCAGCNRMLRNDLEYQRHAAHCSKAYLNYSKHIPAAVVAESCIRIKNENEVEAAAAAEALARNAGVSLDMAPVVSLTRISTPEIMAAQHGGLLPPNEPSDAQIGKSGKKSTKKGVSKKDLKRVDELLKNTMDVLVSIKHEPEVHVETDVHEGTSEIQTNMNENESDLGAMQDFHHGDDDSEDTDDDVNNDNNDCLNNITAIDSVSDGAVSIKKEVNDPSYKEDLSVTHLQIKQEIVDADENNEDNRRIAKMPVLKLKIKKEHGTLNSSLVDEQNVLGERKKKKKKRKESEKCRGKTINNKTQEINAVDETVNPTDTAGQTIKQERLDDIEMREANTSEHNADTSIQAVATVMTSIPITQFQIAAVSSGVEFNDTEVNNESEIAATTSEFNLNHDDANVPDIKPNKEELDRMFQITNISSGVEMAQETPTSTDSAVSLTANKLKKHKVSPSKTTQRTPQCGRAKAVKSTSGLNKNSGLVDSVLNSNTIETYKNIQIKPEPIDRGYEDICNAYEDATNVATAQVNAITTDTLDEQDYINTIDFNNIKIKQEKDIEISDVELTSSEIGANVIPNGINDVNSIESQISENDESNDESDETDSEDYQESEKEEEVREYREMEMPPLLPTSDTEEEKQSKNIDVPSVANINVPTKQCLPNAAHTVERTELNHPCATPFLITSVYSQAENGAINQFNTATAHVSVDAGVEATPSSSVSSLKITSVEAGYAKFTDDDVSPAKELSTQNETLQLQVIQEKEDLLNAQPFTNDNPTITNTDGDIINDGNEEVNNEDNGVEEQQNVLNHEVAALHSIHSTQDGDSSSAHMPRTDVITTTLPHNSATDLVSQVQVQANLINNVEETENLMNESTVEAQRQQQEQEQRIRQMRQVEEASRAPGAPQLNDGNIGEATENDSRLGNDIVVNNPFLLDDSNINEIAENNNNANIERELQDDVAVAVAVAAEYQTGER